MVSQEAIALEPISPPLPKLFCNRRRRNHCASAAAADTGSMTAHMRCSRLVEESTCRNFSDLTLGPASALLPGPPPAAMAAAHDRCGHGGRTAAATAAGPRRPPAAPANPSRRHFAPPARERNIMARNHATTAG